MGHPESLVRSIQTEAEKIAEEDEDFRQKASTQAAEEEYRRHLAAYEQNLRDTRIRDQQTWNSLKRDSLDNGQIVKSSAVIIKKEKLTIRATSRIIKR